MRRAHRFVSVAVGVCLLKGCVAAPPSQPMSESVVPAEFRAWVGLRLDQLQVIGSHNSYKRAVQPELMAMIRAAGREAEAIDYSHLSLTDQLNLGLRNLELDVYWDPTGGRYADPAGNRLLRARGVEPWPTDGAGLQSRGFKLLHDADFDFRTWHVTLEGALRELRAWSAGRPGHVPVVVTMNTKQGSSRAPGGTDAAPFDGTALRELDSTITRELGRSAVLTPDDVRGSSPTLRDAVTSRGWPRVEEAAGRFVFVLDEGRSVRERYLEEFPGLRGGVFFVTADADDPNAGVMVINDPVADEGRIRELVSRGFLVRTRADADTREARRNDLSRFDAAVRSGAHVITTDYAIPDRKVSDSYMVRFEQGAFVRPNPVTGPHGAMSGVAVPRRD